MGKSFKDNKPINKLTVPTPAEEHKTVAVEPSEPKKSLKSERLHQLKEESVDQLKLKILERISILQLRLNCWINMMKLKRL